MLACPMALLTPGCAAAQRPAPGRPLQRTALSLMRAECFRDLAVMYQQAGIARSRRQQRRFQLAAAESSGGDSGDGDGSSSGSRAKKKTGPKTHTAEPQPELQAWLEQQGLTAAAADEHARRFVRVFGNSQQAALVSLRSTFNFCASQGLTGPQMARLLDCMAANSNSSVADFASTAQHNWLLIDGYIVAHVQRQRQAGEQLPKHTTFGALAARSPACAAPALVAPSGTVEAWLAVVGQRLSAEDIGRLLLGSTNAVKLNPDTALAAMDWAVDELGIPAAAVADFVLNSPRLLTYSVPALRANLAALQQTLQHLRPPAPQQQQQQQQQRQQQAAELARRLARKCPNLLGAKSDTVQAAAAWLQRRFPDPEQLLRLLERAPGLLTYLPARYERNAAQLQQLLGWQPGDGQLQAFIWDHPQSFASQDFGGQKVQAMLRFLADVVGLPQTDCLVKYSTYLKYALEIAAARYMLVQEWAPQLLFGRGGDPSLTWVAHAPAWLSKYGAATKAELLAWEREWPHSEEGRRLLGALRSGSTEGWPRPSTRP